jgi:hypothetical protein
MRILLTGTLILALGSGYAVNNNFFQQFENEYNIGYGFSQGTLINGAHDEATYNYQSLNLEVERLFDMGLWLDGNFNLVTSYHQPNLGYLNGGNGSGVAFGQDPFMYSINVKLGYAFSLINHSLQLTPYLMLGRNANWANSTILANGSIPLTTDYFLTGGLGARLSYRINSAILLFADQMYNYNWDQSGAVKSIQSAPSFYGKSYASTNYGLTTMLGAKFNLIQKLQLGVDGFWHNYQPQSNISSLIYTPTNTYGAMVSVGLTY